MPTPNPGEYAGAASSSFDRLRSPSRLERLGGSERGRQGMESARAHGRSSAWDDDIASPGGGKGAEGAAGVKEEYDEEAAAARGGMQRASRTRPGTFLTVSLTVSLSERAARPPRWAAAPRFRRRDSEPA